MKWLIEHELENLIQIPKNYSLTILDDPQIEDLIPKLTEWYPEIKIGAGREFLDPTFYKDHTFLKDSQEDKRILPLIFSHQGKLCGFAAFEKDFHRKSVTSHTLAISPTHRKAKLGTLYNELLENMGKAMGAGVAYWYGSLLHPYSQIVAENRNWKLCGIFPGYNLRQVDDDQIKRIYAALYVKILDEKNSLLKPLEKNLTDQTKKMFHHIFSD